MARPRGATNKNKEFLLKRLKDMFGEDFDPILQAARSAVRMTEIAKDAKDTDLEFDHHKECVNAWDKVASYTTPKLKAIEVSGDSDDGSIAVKIISYADSDKPAA